MLSVITLVLPPFDTNCYIVSEKDGKKCIIVDPASSPSRITNIISERKLSPVSVVLTHGHFDHIGAADLLRKLYNVPLCIHEADAELLVSPEKNASKYLTFDDVIITSADILLKDGSIIEFGKEKLRVMHTPGHTKGSCVLVGENALFSGDTLFRGGYGRCDLYGGNMSDLFLSLERLFFLNECLTVYPGHGEKTTIGDEKMKER